MQHAFLPATAPPVRLLPSQRRARGPWTPTAPAGPYKLPRAVLDRLCVVLGGFRNADAAYALAVFLGRFWSAPGRLDRAFPVDRRALTDHANLGLTEGQVRGALRVLETIGFIEREFVAGSRLYQRTATGPHRRPITFRFGREFSPAFREANARAQAARGTPSPARRPVAPLNASRPSTGLLEAPSLRLPIAMSVAGNLLMGSAGREPAKRGFREVREAPAIEPGSDLGSALARLQAAVFCNQVQSPEGDR